MGTSEYRGSLADVSNALHHRLHTQIINIEHSYMYLIWGMRPEHATCMLITSYVRYMKGTREEEIFAVFHHNSDRVPNTL